MSPIQSRISVFRIMTPQFNNMLNVWYDESNKPNRRFSANIREPIMITVCFIVVVVLLVYGKGGGTAPNKLLNSGKVDICTHDGIPCFQTSVSLCI